MIKEDIKRQELKIFHSFYQRAINNFFFFKISTKIYFGNMYFTSKKIEWEIKK